MAGELSADHRMSTDRAISLFGDRPRHAGHALRDPADDFALEVLDDLFTALGPHRGRCHLPAVLEDERIRKVWKRVRRRLIVIRMIGCLLVPARTGAEGL